MRRQKKYGDLRFQAPKRVGPPIKNQGPSAKLDSLQAVGYYKIMKNYTKETSKTGEEIQASAG